jgi:hypothetical protein
MIDSEEPDLRANTTQSVRQVAITRPPRERPGQGPKVQGSTGARALVLPLPLPA